MVELAERAVLSESIAAAKNNAKLTNSPCAGHAPARGACQKPARQRAIFRLKKAMNSGHGQARAKHNCKRGVEPTRGHSLYVPARLKFTEAPVRKLAITVFAKDRGAAKLHKKGHKKRPFVVLNLRRSAFVWHLRAA